jgi:hypothetical protein
MFHGDELLEQQLGESWRPKRAQSDAGQ